MRPEVFAELLSAYTGPDAALLDFLQALQRQRLKLVESVMRLRGAPLESGPRLLLQILIDWLRLRRINARLIEFLVDNSADWLSEKRDLYRSISRYSAISFDISTLIKN